ncbi:MAG TPA: hypothetical protein VFI44_03235 [Ornithinibacter sp.]|nr:hypothetical protein [Ornithinibacter sp.]
MTRRPEPGLRDRMSSALPAAMRARDRVAVAALRSALAAVANAEAVHIDTVPRAGAIERAQVGAGAADAPRLDLSEDDVRAVVEAEVAEHDRDARHLADVGRPDEATAVRAQADVLRALLDGG